MRGGRAAREAHPTAWLHFWARLWAPIRTGCLTSQRLTLLPYLVFGAAARPPPPRAWWQGRDARAALAAAYASVARLLPAMELTAGLMQVGGSCLGGARWLGWGVRQLAVGVWVPDKVPRSSWSGCASIVGCGLWPAFPATRRLAPCRGACTVTAAACRRMGSCCHQPSLSLSLPSALTGCRT